MKITNDKLKNQSKNKIMFMLLRMLVVIGIAIYLNQIIIIKNTTKYIDNSVKIEEDNSKKVNETNEKIEKVKNIIKDDTKGYTELVNKDHAVKDLRIQKDLVVPKINLVAAKNNDKNLLRKEAAKALEDMLNAAKAEANINIFLNSGYRSAERQVEVYNAEIHSEGEVGKSYVALPGHSEHQTGLAVDLTCKEIKFRIEEKFEKTKEGKWLINNAHEYGYILRYPRGKEKETGYNYEPWHYRYVGKDLSKYLKEENFTLEELYSIIGK